MADALVKVPDIGGEGAEVIEINVAPGDTVDSEDTVITLESDKATMEIPATQSGTISEILVKVGDRLNEGDDMLRLATAADETPAPQPATETKPEPVSAPAPEAPQTTAPAAEATTQVIDIPVPDIGGESAPVIEISVAAGDQVEVDDALITLESDKATMEIPATHAGKITAIHIKIGDTLGQGDRILSMEVTSEQAPAAPVAQQPAAPAKPETPIPAALVMPTGEAKTAASLDEVKSPLPEHVHAGPAVRRMAREFGVDLSKVTATGPRGRILKEDVQAYVKARLAKPEVSGAQGGAGLPEIPEVDFSQWGDVQVEPLNRLRQVAARNFQRSWLNIPHVTQHDEADITELETFRKAQKSIAEARGTRLTPLPFLLKAAAYALREMPQFCASLSVDGKSRILKQYVHIGIAVDTPDGLLVPVIKDVDKKGLWELAAECAELADKARKKQLKPDEMKGGCFTISSLGSIGGTGFTPVVNSPEVAILGVSKAQMKPSWNGKGFDPRLMLPLSLSYDHRAINGAEAAKFTVLLATLLADIRKLLL